MSEIKVDDDGVFSLTLSNGRAVRLRGEDIMTLARMSAPDGRTQLVLTGGDRITVKESVTEILDACEVSEGRA
jgi:uncharacterized protein YlzI (FlbEa/FlbD family)